MWLDGGPGHNGRMKITKLEWRGVQVPLRSGSPWPHGRSKDRYGLLLWIFTDEGFVGVGDASPVGPSSGDGISEVASLLHDLAPSALGMSPTLAFDVLSSLAPHTTAGSLVRLGLDTATVDLLGQQAIRPVADLLGGVIDWVPMNASLDFLEPDEAAAKAVEAVAGGYSCVKLSLGSRDPDVDVEVVRRVREAIGYDVDLRADGDEIWTAEQAIEVLRRLEPYDLEFVEQPVIAEDLTGMAKIRRSVAIPIAADEAVWTLADAENVVAAAAADVLVVKPTRAAGLREAYAILEFARDNGVGAVVDSSMETGVGIAAALHLAAALGPARACGLGTGLLLEHDMLKNPLVPVRGHITVPQMPGLGVEIDHDAVDHYTTGVMGVIAG